MDDQQLEQALQKVGKECFVTYLEKFADFSIVNKDVAAQIKAEKNYTDKACQYRTNDARRIIRAGQAVDALINISQSNVPSHVMEKARKIAERANAENKGKSVNGSDLLQIIAASVGLTFTYAIDNILKDGCFLDRAKLEMVLQRLKDKKNLILQGPPGTGKTWLATKLAFALLGGKDRRRVERFQFHPNLSYGDFIRGYRPQGEKGPTLVDGPFLKVVNNAKEDPDRDYALVIEDINRGNPAQIFGEMLTLLEADKREYSEALTLAHPHTPDERVYIPPNVYVIGTMNVADRSLALFNLALRRRFAFVDLEPIFDTTWRDWVNQKCDIDSGFLSTIANRLTSLNEQIAADHNLGPQFRIGHSVVTPQPNASITDPIKWFTDVVETEIGPMLDEYWFDNADEAQKAKRALLEDL